MIGEQLGGGGTPEWQARPGDEMGVKMCTLRGGGSCVYWPLVSSFGSGGRETLGLDGRNPCACALLPSFFPSFFP
jgi:hypothetical protein